MVDKSNEITAVPERLDALLLKGCIVTLDAMGCQRKTAAKIVGAGADHVISLKGNQGTLRAEVAAFLEDASWDHDYLLKLLRSGVGPACHPQKN